MWAFETGADADEMRHATAGRRFGKAQAALDTARIFRRIEILAGLDIPGGVDDRVDVLERVPPPVSVLVEKVGRLDDVGLVRLEPGPREAAGTQDQERSMTRVDEASRDLPADEAGTAGEQDLSFHVILPQDRIAERLATGKRGVNIQGPRKR